MAMNVTLDDPMCALQGISQSTSHDDAAQDSAQFTSDNAAQSTLSNAVRDLQPASDEPHATQDDAQSRSISKARIQALNSKLVHMAATVAQTKTAPRTCTACKNSFPPTSFYKHDWMCITCKKDYAKKRYEKKKQLREEAKANGTYVGGKRVDTKRLEKRLSEFEEIIKSQQATITAYAEAQANLLERLSRLELLGYVDTPHTSSATTIERTRVTLCRVCGKSREQANFKRGWTKRCAEHISNPVEDERFTPK